MTKKQKLDKENEKKEIVISKMLGLKSLPYPNKDAVTSSSDYKGNVFFRDLKRESWYVYPKFQTDMNWQHEAIDFVENLGYPVQVCKKVCEIFNKSGYSKFICVENETKAESIFEALYQFAKNDLIEK